MRKRAFVILASLAVCALVGPASRAQAPSVSEGLRLIESMESAFRGAIETARPSVVTIALVRNDSSRAFVQQEFGNGPVRVPIQFQFQGPEFGNPALQGVGSGIVLHERGLVLTCYHVVRTNQKYGDKIQVRGIDGKAYDARIYAADPRSDLAVLELVSATPLKLKPIKIGDGGKVFLGQFVLALGNPFGVGAQDGSTSASWGIISNIRRRPSPETYRDKENPERQSAAALPDTGTLIQTDARLNMGVSGGALINARGELVGITMALAAMDGLDTPGGFAAPTDELTRRTIETLAQGREMEYGFLGINPVDLSANGLEPRGNLPPAGALIMGIVSRYLPAYQHGLREGDVITEINGTPVRNKEDLILNVGKLPAGTVLHTKVVREGEVLELQIPLAKFPVQEGVIAVNQRPDWNGLQIDHLSTLIAQSLRGYEPLGSFGVAVREVTAGSQAQQLGVKKGEIIAKVNGKQIYTPDEFAREIEAAKGPVRLQFHPPREVVFNANADK